MNFLKLQSGWVNLNAVIAMRQEDDDNPTHRPRWRLCFSDHSTAMVKLEELPVLEAFFLRHQCPDGLGVGNGEASPSPVG